MDAIASRLRTRQVESLGMRLAVRTVLRGLRTGGCVR